MYGGGSHVVGAGGGQVQVAPWVSINAIYLDGQDVVASAMSLQNNATVSLGVHVNASTSVNGNVKIEILENTSSQTRPLYTLSPTQKTQLVTGGGSYESFSFSLSNNSGNDGTQWIKFDASILEVPQSNPPVQVKNSPKTTNKITFN